MDTYQTPGPTSLRLRLTAGEILVRTAEVTETTVEVEVIRGDPSAAEAVLRDASPTADGGTEVRVEVPQRTRVLRREPSYRVRVTAPNGASLEARTASGGVSAAGGFGAVDVRTASGSVDVGDVDGDASVRTASGSITVATVGGDADLRTVSGSVRVGRVAGSLRVSGVSGSTEVGEARGSVSIESVSGGLRIARLGAGGARLRTVSGSVTVGIEPGLRIWLDLSSTSGRTTSDLAPDEGPPQRDAGARLELRVSTVSGDVHVTSAPSAAVVEA